jgi:hypothetical protein
VTPKTEVFLGVIAIATLLMAIVQVAVIVAAALLARRMTRLVERVEQDIKPLFAHLNAIGRDASRAAALATAQVERADRLFADVAVRVEETLNGVQTTLGAPLREGRALLSAFRAGLAVIREIRQNSRARQARGEDEDALFI